MSQAITEFWNPNRFTVLLAAFLLLLVTLPIASAISQPLVAHTVVQSTFLILLVIGSISISRSYAACAVMISLVVASTVLRILAYSTDSWTLEALAHLTSILALGIIVVYSVRELLTGADVTHDRISASLCAYGFLAAFWAAAFSLLELLQPGSFHYLSVEQAAQGMHFGFGDSTQALYFSLVTITTLGYGDIVPNSDPARLMAATEAFMGQAYVAVLVARLVGLHIAAESVKKS